MSELILWVSKCIRVFFWLSELIRWLCKLYMPHMSTRVSRPGREVKRTLELCWALHGWKLKCLFWRTLIEVSSQNRTRPRKRDRSKGFIWFFIDFEYFCRCSWNNLFLFYVYIHVYIWDRYRCRYSYRFWSRSKCCYRDVSKQNHADLAMPDSRISAVEMYMQIHK